jgi:hypothetical protein
MSDTFVNLTFVIWSPVIPDKYAKPRVYPV